MPLYLVVHHDPIHGDTSYGPFSDMPQAIRWRRERLDRDQYEIRHVKAPYPSEQAEMIFPSYPVDDVQDLLDLIEQFRDDDLDAEGMVNLRIKGHYIPLKCIHHNGTTLTFDAGHVDI